MQDKPQTPAGGRGAPPPNAQQGGGAGRRGGVQAPGVVFDSDMGRNMDAAIALAMAYSLGAKGRAIAVGVSQANLDAAAYCETVARFYTGDPAARSTGTTSILPVGYPEDGPKAAASPMVSAPLAMKKPDGSPLFPHAIRSAIDTADIAVLYRNALLTQKDGEALVVLAGPATNLVRALALKGAAEIIAAKTALLVVAAGAYPEGPADPRIRADIGAARQLFARWPSPIVAVGVEAGNALRYPGAALESDLSWSPAHPVLEAYRAHQKAPYDISGQAPAAVLYAADQKDGYFRLSEPGTIQVLDDGRTRFAPSALGRHRYLIVEPAQQARIMTAIRELTAAKPVIPAGRGFRVQQANPAAVAK